MLQNAGQLRVAVRNVWGEVRMQTPRSLQRRQRKNDVAKAQQRPVDQFGFIQLFARGAGFGDLRARARMRVGIGNVDA